MVANEPDIHAAAEAIRLSGGHVTGFEADVSDAAQVTASFDAGERLYGPVEVSVHSLDAVDAQNVGELAQGAWGETLQTGVAGILLCCREAATRMGKAKTGGRLINIAGSVMPTGLPHLPHVAAALSAVADLTRSLAREVGRNGVTVNCVCPGVVDAGPSQRHKQSPSSGWIDPGGMESWVEARVPLGRTGTTDDVAGLIAFLSGKDAGYITGQTIHVDGGLLLT